MTQYGKRVRIICGGISISALFLLWYFATDGTKLGQVMPGPVTVIRAFGESFIHPIGKYTIIGHTLWSLSRVMIGLAAASGVGILIGLGMGWNRTAAAVFKPLIEMIRPIPAIAWIPLAILWFGLGETTKYFLIFLAGFFNVTLNAYRGASSVDPNLVGAARMLGTREDKIFFSVVLPASIPYIFAGLQIAVTTSWATVVAAEMVRSSEGLGWLINSGREINDTVRIFTGIVAVGLMGFVFANIMREVENRVCKWNS